MPHNNCRHHSLLQIRTVRNGVRLRLVDQTRACCLLLTAFWSKADRRRPRRDLCINILHYFFKYTARHLARTILRAKCQSVSTARTYILVDVYLRGAPFDPVYVCVEGKCNNSVYAVHGSWFGHYLSAVWISWPKKLEKLSTQDAAQTRGFRENVKSSHSTARADSLWDLQTIFLVKVMPIQLIPALEIEGLTR